MEPWEIDDLRVAGADGRDRRAGAARRGRGGDRPLGAPPRRDRRGDRDRRAARALARRRGRRDSGPLPHRRLPALRGRAEPRRPRPRVPLPELPPRGRRRCSTCSAPTRSARARSSRAATTSSCSRAPCAGPGSTPPSCACGPSYRGLALTLDGTGRIGSLDPFTGGAVAILEAARNVACAGGEPLGFTDCLNFGNPEKPEIGWELAESIEGMAQACEALGLPIVSGNVSLYNDTDGRSIHPTPVVGCVGLVPDVRRVPGALAAGRRDPARSAGAPGSPRLRAAGALRHRLRARRRARPRGRGGARPSRLRARAALLARARRLRRRPRRRARRGCDPLRRRRRGSTSRSTR